MERKKEVERKKERMQREEGEKKEGFETEGVTNYLYFHIFVHDFVLTQRVKDILNNFVKGNNVKLSFCQNKIATY